MVPEQSSTPLQISWDVRLPDESPRAGMWYRPCVTVRNPIDSGKSYELEAVASHQSGVELDDDLIQRGIEIRPGERYRFTFGVRTSSSPTIQLDSIRLQFREDLNDTYPLRHGDVAVLPSLRKEIDCRVESICRYEAGTKVLLKLEHKGATKFRRFGIGLEEGPLVTGKTWGYRDDFKRGDEEELELVVGGDEINVVLKCVVDGEIVEDRICLPVPPVEQSRAETFRFLELKRLSNDDVVIWPEGQIENKIDKRNAAFPLRTGHTYRVEIKPTDATVVNVELADLPGVFHVRHVERMLSEKSWRFLIDVAGEDHLFSRPERMFYKVTSGDGSTAGGEIHVQLLPTRSRRWRASIALGLALTFQGVLALARFIQDPGTDIVEAMVEFDLRENYQLLFLPCIPLFWIALWATDRARYRLSN